MAGRAAARRAAVLAALVAAGCTATTHGHGVTGSASPTGGPTAPPTSSPPTSCTTYATPDPNRPKMTLRFTIAASHRTVAGHETVVFRPDLPITELVFRLTANTAPSVQEGNQIDISSASADHGGEHYRFTRANAAPDTQGALLHIPFAAQVPAGTVVTASIDFVLTLGAESFDRFGRTGQFAYFGSGEPLLAWQRGYGWHTEDMIDFPAESATSEAMDVDLSVTAPVADTVIMSGDPATPPSRGDTRTWHSTISAARDVSVAAGPFAVSDATVEGVRLRVGATNAATASALIPQFERAITVLAKQFGPYPFPSLSVARLPSSGGGIEYPSSILLFDGSQLVVVHETAHQWFYAMVGDSQALHPWLDEAFATYAEALVDHHVPQVGEISYALRNPHPVDASTESYGNNSRLYYFVTYFKGSAALFRARQAAGPAGWDAALRCFAAANAWRIVTPSDFERALAKLPAAIHVLQRAGALP